MSYNDYSSYASSADISDALILLIALAFYVAVFVISYLITIYPKYYMIKTSGVGATWTAFIPVLNDIQLFKMAGYKWWTYFLYLAGISLSWVPILGWIASICSIIFLCVVFWKVSENFGLGTFGKVITLFLGIWVHWYIALTKKPYRAVTQGDNYPTQNGDQNWYQQQPDAQNQNWYQNNN